VHSQRSRVREAARLRIAKLGSALGESTPQTRASMLIGTPDYMSPEQHAESRSAPPRPLRAGAW